MSTLAEVEKAVRELPAEDQHKLFGSLKARLSAGAGFRDFRVNPPTPEEVAEGRRVLTEMRQRFKVTRYDDPDGPAADPDEWDALREVNDAGGGGSA